MIRYIFTLIFVVGMIAGTGCGRSTGRDAGGLAAGINLARAADPTTAEFRIEAELIPDARLVREDTTPIWHHGRFGFLEGREMVLVVNRITSMEAFAVTDGGPRETVRGERQDRILERMWIAIPGNAEVGEVIRLQDIEHQRRLGYDRGEIGRDQYSEPFRTLGTLVIRAIRDREVEIEIDMVVRPQRHRDWRVSDTFVLSLDQAPRYARAADPSRVPWTVRDATPDISSIFNTPRTLGAAPELEPLPGRPVPVVPEAGQPAAGTSDRAEEVPVVEEDESPLASSDGEAVVGRWTVRTPDWTIRMQFERDGRFAYSSRRNDGNYAAGIKRGTWRVADGRLTMQVTSYEYDGLDHLAQLGGERAIRLTMEMVGDRMRLRGDFLGREGRMDLMLIKAAFPSLMVDRQS